MIYFIIRFSLSLKAQFVKACLDQIQYIIVLLYVYYKKCK